MNRFAVLLTCFNRCELTLNCLKRLFELEEGDEIDVFLVDDNSTDGTRQAVTIAYPNVIIIQGNGNLYWNRGMHLAWKTAVATAQYDYFLLLNDDVFLYKNSFKEVLECSKLLSDEAIISGVIESDTGDTLYGGSDENKQLINPRGSIQDIKFMNGNFVLVPYSVYKKIGMLDPVYHHDLGDVDYGLRAKKYHVRVVTSRVAIGQGQKNSICRVRKWGVSISKRFKTLYSPLGNHPSINFYFKRNHYGYLHAFSYYIFIHFLNIIPDKISFLLFGNKYK